MGNRKRLSDLRDKQREIKLTRFFNGIKMGMKKSIALRYAGISLTSWHNWLAQDNTNAGIEGGLLEQRYFEAQGVFASIQLKRINNAASDPKHWQAAKWLLEQMFKEEYGEAPSSVTENKDEASLHARLIEAIKAVRDSDENGSTECL